MSPASTPGVLAAHAGLFYTSTYTCMDFEATRMTRCRYMEPGIAVPRAGPAATMGAFMVWGCGRRDGALSSDGRRRRLLRDTRWMVQIVGRQNRKFEFLSLGSGVVGTLIAYRGP